MKSRSVHYLPWALGSLVTVLAVVAWAQSYGWQLFPFNSYRFFPLFGLLAFSLMWTHYVTGFLREWFHWSLSRTYFLSTSWLILALILLHPGLLIYQRLVDGFGLPPHSYYSYVAPGLGWVTLLGTVSLAIFLLFELHRLYGERSWWHIVRKSSDLAMLAIFYHSLRLGSQLQHGWFKAVWWFYGLSLVAILIYNYHQEYFGNRKKPRTNHGAF